MYIFCSVFRAALKAFVENQERKEMEKLYGIFRGGGGQGSDVK
jgi:hypothetical protein